MKKTVIAFAAGCLTALAGVAVVNAVLYVERMPAPSVAALAQPLTPLESHAGRIISGVPNFRAVAFAVTPDKSTIAGVWAADGPSTFEWSYGTDEAVYLHEGQVHVEYLGRKFTVNAGESAFFYAGTKATWHVPQGVRKSWTLHNTGHLVKWYRQLTGATKALPATPVSPANPA